MTLIHLNISSANQLRAIRLMLLSQALAAIVLLALFRLAGASNLTDKANPQPVIYAWAASMAEDERGHYPISLLKLALVKSGEAYDPKPSKRDMPQWRTLRHVQLGKDLDVVWTFTTPEREQSLLPIRIPIDRGLLGWRLLLINAADAERFSRLDSAGQLRALRSGQGHDWPDFPILKANGFKVSPSSSYQGLFSMLQRQRIAYFPRSLTEIEPEVRAHKAQSLVVAPKWVLHYPAPLYFFVSREKPALAAAIERGLLAAIKDGSMRQLFQQHFGESIAHANLSQRTVLTLTNPFLTEATPLQRADLWFSPALGF
ncbi:type 2 periplasmic-binding domain-containing protein [Undibacterium flavidum]|uniref:Transporter substrate-binding domain-containing protein n=1 Tax=Undibacterium flavidum TaxID=2762297 RepID=A0ABR6Y9E4_9BURK|nr:transporter substrate-binding domain-containing protein [Undibacterium flavidum]MBC3873244.1 transporter substrate-binding domain-containing protein [Undibacterium flavidum]